LGLAFKHDASFVGLFRPVRASAGAALSSQNPSFLPTRIREDPKEKEAKRKKSSEGGGLWKLPQRRKSTKDAFSDIFFIDFHHCLKKSARGTLRLFHSYTQARRRLIYQLIFQRQRSTLEMPISCLKDGEYRSPRTALVTPCVCGTLSR
jgi:hypothetical protein